MAGETRRRCRLARCTRSGTSARYRPCPSLPAKQAVLQIVDFISNTQINDVLSWLLFGGDVFTENRFFHLRVVLGKGIIKPLDGCPGNVLQLRESRTDTSWAMRPSSCSSHGRCRRCVRSSSGRTGRARALTRPGSSHYSLKR